MLLLRSYSVTIWNDNGNGREVLIFEEERLKRKNAKNSN
jgi:hypothetical protein